MVIFLMKLLILLAGLSIIYMWLILLAGMSIIYMLLILWQANYWR